MIIARAHSGMNSQNPFLSPNGTKSDQVIEKLLIPDIPFIIFNLIFFQETTVLLFERLLFMMFFLIKDIVFNHVCLFRIDRKPSVAVLPVKIFVLSSFCFHPFGRRCFYFFNQFHQRDRKSTRLNSSHTDISRMPSSA